jgi:hypothetical protein
MSRKALGTFGILNATWKSTGGLSEKLQSFDFWLALSVTIACYATWNASDWPSHVTSVLPNVLGFTLGGFAVFLGFGSDTFRTLLAQSDPDSTSPNKGDETPYMSTSSAFMYFVTVQLVAILYALVATAMFKVSVQSLPSWSRECVQTMIPVASGFGYFLFIYSLATSLRAALRIYRLSRWYSAFVDSGAANNQEAHK